MGRVCPCEGDHAGCANKVGDEDGCLEYEGDWSDTRAGGDVPATVGLNKADSEPECEIRELGRCEGDALVFSDDGRMRCDATFEFREVEVGVRENPAVEDGDESEGT
jgi:hypothetical protein